MSGNFNRGPKIFADNAALIIGTPDYVGQLGCTADGVGFSFSRDLISGGFIEDVVCLNNRVYFTNLNVTTTLTSNKFVQIGSGASSYSTFALTGGSYVDNNIYLLNNTGGYAAISCVHPGDSIGDRMLAFAFGPSTGGAAYQDTCFIGINGSIANPNPAGFIISQEFADGTPSNQHVRFEVSPYATKKVILYGWSTVNARGPIGLTIDPNGCCVPGNPKTVANLTAAATAPMGARDFVTDATGTMTANIGAVVAGGGANKVPVYNDTTNWRIG